MANFGEEFLSELRNRCDIVSVVSRYVELKKSASSFVGLCPFHNEKTPSFHVNPAKQFFYCFGCHAGGDAVDCVGKLFRLSPAESISRINDDFQLGLPVGESTMAQRLEAKRRSEELIRQREDVLRARRERIEAYAELQDKWTRLAVQMRDNAPTDREAPYPAAWVEAAKQIDQAGWELNGAELPEGR